MIDLCSGRALISKSSAFHARSRISLPRRMSRAGFAIRDATFRHDAINEEWISDKRRPDARPSAVKGKLRAAGGVDCQVKMMLAFQNIRRPRISRLHWSNDCRR